ncbi:MAG: GNAT family N-acetyltransferase [Candidatus Aenigmatarchaeota archaeon]
MQVRRATAKDLADINRLSMEMHRFLAKQEGLRLSREALDENYTMRDLKTSEIFVAIADGKVVGYIHFSKQSKETEWFGENLELHHLAVAEGFRRKGIGKVLLGLLMAKARKRGLGIRTDALASNMGAIRFYKKMGFKPFQIDLLWKADKKPR